MSGAAVYAAEHAAVEGENKPAAAATAPAAAMAAAEENLAKEQITSSASTLYGEELQLLDGAEKTHVPVDIEEPTSEGGGAMINKQQTHLLAVAEEDDASKKMHLKKKKEKKMGLRNCSDF